jgi:prefoldin subunit 5
MLLEELNSQLRMYKKENEDLNSTIERLKQENRTIEKQLDAKYEEMIADL